MSESDPTAALATLLGQMLALPRTEREPVIARCCRCLPTVAFPSHRESRQRPAFCDSSRIAVARARVMRALTAGVSSKRAIERMRQVQSQITSSAALDELIAAREMRVRMSCPRCKIKLPRVEMIKHLWHEHQLILQKRETRSVWRTKTELRAAFSATGDNEPLDRFAELHGPAGLRRWMAEDQVPIEELSPLLAGAAEHNAGLCPGCYAELPAAVAPLPPPLDQGMNRLSGEGYAVQQGGNAWIRTVSVSMPGSPITRTDISLAPRAVATLAASLVVIFALLVATTRELTLAGIAVGVLTYLFARRVWSQRRDDFEVVDLAWSRLVPAIVERKHGVGFLTRLCLASLGQGDAEARLKTLTATLARAAADAEESEAERHLLAAATVLQIEDAIRFGTDAVAGVAAVAALGFSGERPADFAEFVVGSFLSRKRSAGELGRLRVLLLAAAFEARIVPPDLFVMWAAAPNLKHAMSQEPAHRLALLFGLWRTRESHVWHSVGHGDTVFELARKLPRDAAELLTRFPDVLLWHRPERPVEEAIGPVLICARGVAIAGQLVADPSAEVELESGGHVLIFGRHRIESRRPLPADFPETVRSWLRFRAEWLPTLGESYLAAGTPEISERGLAPFCRRCGVCQTVSAVGCGAVGHALKT
ncbi:MAG: hypothetical protein U0792_12265 [Gemmataceae bacterium]